MTEIFNGVIAIVYKKKEPLKFLLIKNIRSGNITFPAGGCKEGEKFITQTLKRELREETGLLPNNYKIVRTPIVYEFTYNKNKKSRKGSKSMQPIFLIQTIKTDLTPVDPDTEILGWFIKEEVLQMLSFDDLKPFFIKTLKYIRN